MGVIQDDDDGAVATVEIALENLNLEPQVNIAGCMNGTAINEKAFAAKMIRLVDLEQEASEKAFKREWSSANQQLTDMVVATHTQGPLGETLLKFKATSKGSAKLLSKLPLHGPVAVHDIPLSMDGFDLPQELIVNGIVTHRDHESITIYADKEFSREHWLKPAKYCLEPVMDVSAFERMRNAMQWLAGESVSRLAKVCLCQTPLKVTDAVEWRERTVSKSAVQHWKPICAASLDDVQCDAVELTLDQPDLALVHGPPGTGKSTTLVEIIAQHVHRDFKVLACAASNVAVDNLVERLAAVKLPGALRPLKVVRLGHPARLAPSILGHALEAKLKEHLLAQSGAKRASLRSLMRNLSPKQRALAVSDIVAAADVVCATLTGVDVPALRDVRLDLVALDEAGQAVEPACWAAMRRAPKAVLVGDHLQLPPTILSRTAEEEGLGCTLFERLMSRYPEAGVMLTMQYRMNTAIMKWSNVKLYEGKLQAHESCQDRTIEGALSEKKGRRVLKEPELVTSIELKFSKNESKSQFTRQRSMLSAHAASRVAVPLSSLPRLKPRLKLLFLDTNGCCMTESSADKHGSKSNIQEAQVAINHVRRLRALGLDLDQIGIITPYAAQVSLLREMRRVAFGDRTDLDVASVDGFQGREKEAIIFSMVRSNALGSVGFLADVRRMNVAMTRARSHCAIVGDSGTLRKNVLLGHLIRHFENHAKVECADLLC